MPDTTRLTAALADRYAIERELGQGGMATVYLAHDLKHDREVAVKVLKPELVAVIGAERFLQEIRVTAHLQHPHILPLFDSGEAGGFLFYVMPYVDGESLRERLNREKQLPIEEAVEMTKAIASALDHAHRHHVIHRDIKPENVLLHDGQPVVADFGIALAVSVAGGNRLTETGLSLGTPYYMSPEQAMGDRQLDARSDVYSLGAVLYELLAGDPPYTGSTAQAILAKVITEKAPPVTALREMVPSHVAAAIHKALAKLPADRFRTAAEFAEALTKPGVLADSGLTAGAADVVSGPRKRDHLLLAVAGGALALAALAAWGWLRPQPSPRGPLARFALKLPAEARIAQYGALGTASLALSPDGTVLVYAGSQQLFMRRLDQIDPVPIPNTAGGMQPFFSPDGQNVGFFADGRLKRVRISGGPAVALCEAHSTFGASWSAEDIIVFSAGGHLFRVPATGGTPQRTVFSDSASGDTHNWPDFLPDGRHLLITISKSVIDHRVGLADLKSGKVTLITEAGSFGRFVEPGWLAYVDATQGTVFAAPFDWRGARVTGPAGPLVEGVTGVIVGAPDLGLSRNGWVVYQPGTTMRRRLTLVNRHGQGSMIATEARPFSDPRFSPGGRAVAVTSILPGGGYSGDIWILDLQRSTLSRLTFQRRSQFPEWSRDGRRVVFASPGAAGVFWVPASGGAVETLFAKPGSHIYEGVLTRDERTVIYRQGIEPSDVYYARRDTPGESHPFLTTPFDERSPALSPDDHWLAYVSNETGRDEVYVRPFPDGAGKWQISAAGGTEPRWRSDGSELFYRNADTLIAASVRTQPTFAPGPRVPLFTRRYVANPRHATYDVDPSGQGFIFVTADPDESADLILVQNAFSAVPRPMAR